MNAFRDGLLFASSISFNGNIYFCLEMEVRM
jgi:hypothetical protein